MSTRHQCLFNDGSPSLQVEAIAACIKRQLTDDYRCSYMNSEPMLAVMRNYLAAIGIDAAQECSRGSLVLTSDRGHLDPDLSFNIERMLNRLEWALELALRDGFAGLFASGDVAWEFGPRKDFSGLLEYEWRVERFVREHPQFAGVCQYHLGALPPEAWRAGAIVHEAIFLDETLSVPNPNYILARRCGSERDDDQKHRN
jgi:hypothetical protein